MPSSSAQSRCMADRPLLRVVVGYSPAPRVVDERPLVVTEGATVKDVLLASGMLVTYPMLQSEPPEVGIWGRRTRLGQAGLHHAAHGKHLPGLGD